MEGKGKKTMQEAGCKWNDAVAPMAGRDQQGYRIHVKSLDKVSDAGRQRPKAVSCRECPVEDTGERSFTVRT